MLFYIGKVGIVIDSIYYEPASNSTEDKEAAETKMQFAVSITKIKVHYDSLKLTLKICQ